MPAGAQGILDQGVLVSEHLLHQFVFEHGECERPDVRIVRRKDPVSDGRSFQPGEEPASEPDSMRRVLDVMSGAPALRFTDLYAGLRLIEYGLTVSSGAWVLTAMGRFLRDQVKRRL